MERGHKDFDKNWHGHVWGQFFQKLGLYLFLYHTD